VIINPAVVEGQIAGGLAQGIGSVLLEEAGYDARGNPIAATFKDYMLPTIFDVPDFEYVHANTPSKSEGGFRGVGEGGAIIGPPTLVNAIADALAPFGEIEVDLPLTPAKIVAFIDGQPRAPRPASRFAAAAAVEAPARPPIEAEAQDAIPDVLPPSAGGKIDGLWAIVTSAPMGSQEMKGRFATDGAVLTGTLYSELGGQAFAGTIAADAVKWEMKVAKPSSGSNGSGSRA
jgi:carbon-monoxide dehydrogenase large subunit